MSLWKAILKCSDCGYVLNTAGHVPREKKGNDNETGTMLTREKEVEDQDV